jgi:hypothetical protein
MPLPVALGAPMCTTNNRRRTAVASLTQIRKNKERLKIKAQGKVRKVAARKGTTPRFPVHIEDAPDAELPMPAGSAVLKA